MPPAGCVAATRRTRPHAGNPPGNDWRAGPETPISDLMNRPDFFRDDPGMLARRGLFKVSGADFPAIRTAMLQE